MRTCYIHIGTHKTATTSIQYALGGSPAALARAGYVYPLTGRWENLPAQHNIAFELRRDSRFSYADGTVDELLAEIAATDSNIILSSEEFSHALHHAPCAFQDFVDRLRQLCPRVVLIVYLRRQAGYLRSNYFERLKSGFDLTFEEYVMRRLDSDLREFPLDYSLFLSEAERVNGAELTVRSYDAVRCGRAVSDFLAYLGICAEGFEVDAHVNCEQGLTEVFRQFFENRMRRDATEPEKQIICMLTGCLSPTELRVGEATRAAILSRFDQSNRSIAARFGTSALLDEDPRPPNSGAVIDHIFSAELPLMVEALGALPDRLDRTDKALATAQGLAIERFHEIKTLQARLDRTHAALSEVRSRAVLPYDEIGGRPEREGAFRTSSH